MKQATESIFTEIRALYDAYLVKAEELYNKAKKEGATGSLKRLLTGADTFADDSIHMDYFNAMSEAVDRLAECLAGEERGTAEKAAEEVCRLLLEPAAEDRKYMEFNFMADDRECMKLYKYLSTEVLKELYEMCEAEPLLHKATPVQMEFEDMMYCELKRRGAEIPEKSRWQKLKDKLGLL